MAITEVPRSFIYMCDACKHTHKQENASGHYTNSEPPGWATLRLSYTKSTVEELVDATEKLLLCPACKAKAIQLVDTIKLQLPRSVTVVTTSPP